MKWGFLDRAIPDRKLPQNNRFYLHAPSAGQRDPTMVWGTEIDADALHSYLRERNRNGRVVITAAHAVMRATALALVEFPEMNVRLVGRRIWAFRAVNVRLAFAHRRNNDIDVLIVQDANTKSLEQIATEVWQRLLEAGRGEGRRERYLTGMRRIPGFWLRQMFRIYFLLDRHFRLPVVGNLDKARAGAATVNDLSFPGAPPMRWYKPSRFPDPSDSLHLTLGPMDSKVVARGEHFASVNVMPLIVRGDHRLTDAHQVGRFVAAVRNLLNHPERLDAAVPSPTTASASSESSAGVPRDRAVAAHQ